MPNLFSYTNLSGLCVGRVRSYASINPPLFISMGATPETYRPIYLLPAREDLSQFSAYMMRPVHAHSRAQHAGFSPLNGAQHASCVPPEASRMMSHTAKYRFTPHGKNLWREVHFLTNAEGGSIIPLLSRLTFEF